MDDEYEDFEDIRRQMTDRLIKALRHYVKGTPSPGEPSILETSTLLRLGLVEPGEGVRHAESSGGERTTSRHGDRLEATDKGRDWLEWYEART